MSHQTGYTIKGDEDRARRTESHISNYTAEIKRKPTYGGHDKEDGKGKRNVASKKRPKRREGTLHLGTTGSAGGAPCRKMRKGGVL